MKRTYQPNKEKEQKLMVLELEWQLLEEEK